MFKINGISELKNYFRKLKTKVPETINETINKTMLEIKPVLQSEIKSVFDRPTSFAVNSLYINFLSKKNTKGSIKIKDKISSPKRKAIDFMGPEITGGPRRHKGYELKMITKGYMSADKFIVPGPHAKLNKFGNQTPAEIKQTLEALDGAVVPGGWKYFISNDGDSVFKVKGAVIKIIWFIVKNIHYKPRFKFVKTIEDESNRIAINAEVELSNMIK